MVHVTIDGIELDVSEGTLILEAAQSQNIAVPTFCYQKRLAPLASCRMCLVSVENMPKLQPACATPVTDGMVVHTASEQVALTRQSMLELLLANHPLDCPVCDKGGECELQDMVFEYGAGASRFRDQKRVFRSRDLSLNQVIIFNANRCIQCQRCVRICEDVVGAVALGTIDKGMDSEVTGFENSLDDCDHCGNCIEVCPVGALMSQPYRYKARPWDLVETETTCPFCGTGCQLTIGARDGELARVRSKYETGINGETLCVKGRFGIDYIDSEQRIETPLVRRNGALEPASWNDAFDAMRGHIGDQSDIDGRRIGGLASAQLSNETLYLFQKMLRTVFHTNNIDSSNRWTGGIYDELPGLIGGLYSRQSLEEVISADVVLVVGSNVTDDNPVTDYLLRSKIRQQKNHLFLASVRPSRLDADASACVRLLPGDEAVLISTITNRIFDSRAGTHQSGVESLAEFSRQCAEAVKAATTVTVLVGMDFLRTPNAKLALPWLDGLIRRLQGSGKAAALQFLFDRCNQLGAWEMGVLPNHLPGWQKNGERLFEQAWDVQLSSDPGADIHEMLRRCAAGAMDCLYILGSDPMSAYPDRIQVENALSSADLLIVQASHHSATTKLADIVLPGAAFGEEAGTVMNNEGRIQSIRAFRPPIADTRRNIDILTQITEIFGGNFCGYSLGNLKPEHVFSEITQLVPSFAELSPANVAEEGALSRRAGYRDIPQSSALPLPSSVERTGQSNGKLTLVTGDCGFHSGYASEHSATLSGIRAEAYVEVRQSDCQAMGFAQGDLVKIRSPHGETTLSIRTNKQFPPGLAFVPENFASQHLNRLFKQGEFSCLVEILPNEL
ncbi:NADH-quinone oxidoreductase subunit NuoG [Pelagibius sp. Alg239-R121]|uniref:NADH-quinone oxidoreductase subunit NuoG n=1 Tax=Pelagibius sp. Alg239-R121 TaxID=2993448 RepID=UPI0024A6690D|nr:NADH-quinone oxidoreductase subunit NuoG [Pelagibius sp. Alg239-R121]